MNITVQKNLYLLLKKCYNQENSNFSSIFKNTAVQELGLLEIDITDIEAKTMPNNFAVGRYLEKW